MPHDLVTERQTVLERTRLGGHDRVVLQRYEAPATADGGIGEDVRKDYDQWAAAQVMAVLEAEYPDHLWRVVHDSHHGVCLISIPILMGINNYMAVNLRTHALDNVRVKNAGGEILERYGLKRGRLELGSFLDARAQHSALVVPNRKVPG